MELELKHLKLNPVTVTVTPVFPGLSTSWRMPYPRKLIGYTPGFGRRQHLGQVATEEIRRRRGQILAEAGRNSV